MENNIITPHRLTVSQLLSLKNQTVKPIDGLNIPNITMPSHLVSKKRSTEANDTLAVNIRLLFNSLTNDNITESKERLRSIVYAKAQNVEMLNEIAEELLQNFIISEQNIKNYMHLLNAIWNASVLIQCPDASDKVSPTIGNYFLNKCKDMIFNNISEKHIRMLALMDQDDSDDLDKYNREREKIINLIITICHLYAQRTTAYIKLTAVQIFSVLKIILDTYTNIQNKMKELGDPYEDECEDEDEYECCRRMCSIYAEHVYTFLSQQGREFFIDKTVVKDQNLGYLINRFSTEIIPTLTEAYLISKCKSLTFE